MKAYVEFIHCVGALNRQATSPVHGHYKESRLLMMMKMNSTASPGNLETLLATTIPILERKAEK